MIDKKSQFWHCKVIRLWGIVTASVESVLDPAVMVPEDISGLITVKYVGDHTIPEPLCTKRICGSETFRIGVQDQQTE